MLKEFKEFALRGNVVDLAVAVVIGSAFSAITTSLVNDIIMPLIGIITGGHDFSGLQLTVGNAVVKYGVFIQTVINFVLIAAVLFMVVKFMNRLKRKQPQPEEVVQKLTMEQELLTEIRDLLKKEEKVKDQS
ncbi:large-conductance mechanosensitive channel protein MscL [Terribacillus sp. DMT04]|uniref:large-conductance mechanosensitive channel protein MscL n=1 Tax=Terribacillus sp. DMT04 TaxID=2850441 RepID=UPI001C2C2ADD|nr:large-conductance mechanosensitive channel protein MscL [Terribacillus sp. DMT04]QXE02082.1 large-conductance mechanosensitive channel protein MscL [Terribacillus sp. DMT04]